MHSKLKLFLILGVTFAFIALLRLRLFTGEVLREQVLSESSNAPTPTPPPFAELTIPYLRQRSYPSSLGERVEVYEKDNYTAYITSYTSDGLTIFGLLTIPKGERPQNGWPGVVFVHGYIPPDTYKTLLRYEDYVDYLASSGLVVFKIDLRGHGDSDGEAFGAYYDAGYVIDTLNAHAALATSGEVNPDAIGLWGHSMAGNITLRALAVKPEIKAVAVWGGAVFTYEDFFSLGISDRSYQRPPQDDERQRRRDELFSRYGNFDPASEFWRQVVPTNYLDGYKGSIELHHSINDETVDIDYSRNLAQTLAAKGITATLYEYETGGHDIEGESFEAAMKRTVDFYLKTLK